MTNSPLPPRKFRTFLNDKDGLSAKDYLLLISTTIFFLFVSVGLIMILFNQEIDKMYLSLLDMVSPVVMMIVGSVFGINAVEAFTNRKSTQVNVKKEQIVSSPPTPDYGDIPDEITYPEEVSYEEEINK